VIDNYSLHCSTTPNLPNAKVAALVHNTALYTLFHSFPPSSIPSSSPLWQDPLTPSLRFSPSSDCSLSTSRTGISPFFRCWSGRFIRVVHLNLKVRFTGIAWPPIFNLTYTRRSSFQPNAFQEKVHVEDVDRFTVCFFSLSTSVRRSDFSFNSLRLDAVSSKTIVSTSPSTLRFRTAHLYASGSEDPLNIIGQHSLGNAC